MSVQGSTGRPEDVVQEVLHVLDVYERWDDRKRADVALAAIVAERDLLREEIRIREQSQIPMIPRAAQRQLEEARELARTHQERAERLAEALGECECIRPVGVLGAAIPCGEWLRVHPSDEIEMCSRCAALAVGRDTKETEA